MSTAPSPNTDQTPSLSPRQRRLLADYEALRAEFSGHPNIEVEPIGAMPPERYRITYRVSSLRLEGEQPFVAAEHVVDLTLPLSYPREQPLAVPRTPVFHPNVDRTKYCLADYWSAGQPLSDIVLKMGEMLQFRVYNVKSPLNAVAAQWVEEHEDLVPIGDLELGSPDLEIALRPAAPSPDEPDAPAVGSDDPSPAASDEEPGDPDEFAVTLRREPRP